MATPLALTQSQVEQVIRTAVQLLQQRQVEEPDVLRHHAKERFGIAEVGLRIVGAEKRIR